MPTSRFQTAVAVGAALALALGATGCHNLDFSPRYEPGEIGIFDNLFAVSVPDEKHAVAVGYLGAVYFTEDGGDTWRMGESGSIESLYSVSMADALHGWAVGQHGTILRTDDGGRTWSTQPNLKQNEGSHLFGIHAIDSKTAWVVGEWGSRVRTSDGGRTWEDRSLAITFGHPQFVWLDSRDQEKVRTGEKVYEDVGLNSVYCLPSHPNDCWIVGEFGYIFHSEDQGETWIRGEIVGDIRIDPIEFGYNEIEIPSDDVEMLAQFATQVGDATHLNILIEAFVSDREIAEFGSAKDPYQLFDVISARIGEARAVLEDAGVLSDRFRLPSKPPWDYEDFLEDDPTFLQRYIDGRRADKPMIRVGVIQNPYLYTVRFRDLESGLIAGLGGVVLQSQDGGHTWKYRVMDRKQALFSVSTFGDRAIAIGEKGFVRFSNDGGVTWAPPSDAEFPRIFTFMRDLDFEREQRLGLIVGQEGMVLRSRDRGATWSRVLPPESRRRGV
jgi:photosystem II stability/assembly factor-like uncharacterized protein